MEKKDNDLNSEGLKDLKSNSLSEYDKLTILDQRQDQGLLKHFQGYRSLWSHCLREKNKNRSSKKNTDYTLVTFGNDTSRSGRSLHLWKMSNLTESQNDWTPLMTNSLGLILSFDLIEVFIYRQLTIFSFKCQIGKYFGIKKHLEYF